MLQPTPFVPGDSLCQMSPSPGSSPRLPCVQRDSCSFLWLSHQTKLGSKLSFLDAVGTLRDTGKGEEEEEGRGLSSGASAHGQF